MKKRIFSVLLCCAFLLSLLSLTGTFSVCAKSNVTSMDVSVVLESDGSARVTQVWSGTFDSGTEVYIPITNLGESEISDFTVSDQNGKYQTLSVWDTDASFNKKARKCGLHPIDGGYEMCFGLSQYGANVYTFSYTISKMAASYNDYDGFNFKFINDSLSVFPSDAKITITLKNGTELNESNAKIWAFGYTGNIEFVNGKVVAQSTEKLEEDNGSCMIVMMSLKKGIISPVRAVDDSFESVKDKAFGGSNYDDDSDSIWIFIAFAALIAIICIIMLIIVINRKMQLKKLYTNADYYRGTPNDYQLPNSYWLCKNFDINKTNNSIIGAVLLKLMNDGCIEPAEDVSVGFMGKEKKSVSLRLKHMPAESDIIGRKIYLLLGRAAGSDGILQEKELERYVKGDPDSLQDILNDAISAGQNSLQIKGCFKGNPSSSIKNLTDIGKAELLQLMGLKKYLDEFSLISEREIKENAIWQDYLVYATLMGIADKTIAQFKKVYPDMIPQLDNYEYNMLWIMAYNRSCYSSMQAAQAERSAGSGGSSSFGGGGGFSGGGSGGGVR